MRDNVWYLVTIITSMGKNDKKDSINYFDKNDDIILPDNIFLEIIYILIVIKNIIKNPKNRNFEINNLKKQIRFFALWMKIK